MRTMAAEQQSQVAQPLPVVVLVDDDPAVCSSLKFLLDLEGFAVRTYASAAELLACGPVDDCDCFVIDQRMPEMSGIDLIAKLRQQNVLTPAILIISEPTPAVAARAAMARVPMIEKPLLGNNLMEQIRAACGRA